MKIFFYKMWFEPIFLQILWQFLRKNAASPLAGEPQSQGLFLAATGGEIRSNYFKYTEPVRKSQRFMGRLASLGDQIERDFGRKNQLAVLSLIKLKVKENFYQKYEIYYLR